MKPKNILIIHTWGIGDLVMFTPALRALRDNFPDAVIDVLVTHQAVVADVLEANRTVNEIIKFHWKKRNIFEKLNLVLRLRKKQYDWAIVTSWTNPMKGGFLALLSGAK
ncbi:MAG: hypothetical protein Q7R46_02080, partial [bacterium]|nr:hypothetical protein [bacterium]